MAKRRIRGPAVLTANDLLTGDVVFWTGIGWSRAIGEAVRITGEEECEALAAIGRCEEAENRVVGAYLVVLDPVTGAPVELRERRRLAGPSIPLPEPRAA
jgi:hypothetical protein